MVTNQVLQRASDGFSEYTDGVATRDSFQMRNEITLLPHQARFVDEYIVDRNPAAAAIRAGYSERSAYLMGTRLLKQLEVQRAVQARARAASGSLQVSRDDCVRALVEAYKVARATQDGGAMVGAIRELNRMFGFHAPAPVCVGRCEA